jgi:hypothetical protein
MTLTQRISDLATAVQGKFNAHVAASDPHGDRAYARATSNLIINGLGELGSNYGFSQLQFDPAYAYTGRGSFSTSTGATFICDTNVFISPDETLKLTAYVFSGDYEGNNHSPGTIHYAGVAEHDIDGNQIRYFNKYTHNGTLTTLASALNPGDTEIILSSAANWNANVYWDSRQILLWPYYSLSGIKFNAEYSRNWSGYYNNNYSSGNGLWLPGGISGNTITLRVPWGGGSFPAGSPICQSYDGNSYKYSIFSGQTMNAGWNKFSTTISGLETAGYNAAKFSHGTAYIRPLMLINYSGAPSLIHVQFFARYA